MRRHRKPRIYMRRLGVILALVCAMLVGLAIGIAPNYAPFPVFCMWMILRESIVVID